MSEKLTPEQLAEYQRLMEKVAYIQEHDKEPDVELLTDEESQALKNFFYSGLPTPKGDLLIKKEYPRIYVNFRFLFAYGSPEYEQAKENLGKISWRVQFRQFCKENGIETA